MKDKFYYVLKDCLSNRQSWVRETEIYFKFRHLKEKANNKIFEGNIILKKLFFEVKPKFFPTSIRFCDWYKNDDLASIYT